VYSQLLTSIQEQRTNEYNVTGHWRVLRDLLQSGRLEDQIDSSWTYASFFKSIRGSLMLRTPIWKGTPVLFGKDLRPLIGVIGTMVGIDNETTSSGACEWCITAAEPNSNRQPTYPGCFSVPQDRHADIEDNNAIWLCRGACMNCFVRGQPCTSQSGRRPIGTPQLAQGEVFMPRFQANRSGSSVPSSQDSAPTSAVSSFSLSASRSQTLRFPNHDYASMSEAQRRDLAAQLTLQAAQFASTLLSNPAQIHGSPTTMSSMSPIAASPGGMAAPSPARGPASGSPAPFTPTRGSPVGLRVSLGDTTSSSGVTQSSNRSDEWQGFGASPPARGRGGSNQGGSGQNRGGGPPVRGGGPSVRGSGPPVRGGGPPVRGGGPSNRGGGLSVRGGGFSNRGGSSPNRGGSSPNRRGGQRGGLASNTSRGRG